jgi:hypothetical protein
VDEILVRGAIELFDLGSREKVVLGEAFLDQPERPVLLKWFALLSFFG